MPNPRRPPSSFRRNRVNHVPIKAIDNACVRLRPGAVDDVVGQCLGPMWWYESLNETRDQDGSPSVGNGLGVGCFVEYAKW